MKEIRRGNRIDTTTKLRQVIEKTLEFLPEKERKDTVKKTCQRVFQALRIDVNRGILKCCMNLWKNFREL